MGWNSYVAIGDSFTEGLDDPYEDGRGFRGWADLVAAQLATHAAADSPSGDPGFRYANLAIRGKLFDQVVADQLPAALEMRADLYSFAAGGNDALRRGFEVATLAERFERVVAQLRGTGADVVLFRFANVSVHLPARKTMESRSRVINDMITEVGARQGAHVIDLWGDEAFGNRRLWASDRLHMSPTGHRRVAAHLLTALGVPADEEWLAAVPPPESMGWTKARAADARWAATHLAPWIKRRLTGKSSGDLLAPKRPTLENVI
jgi:lysophospholipase L1-like esterase